MTASMRWAPELAGRLARRNLAERRRSSATWRAGALLDEAAAHALRHRGRPVADAELLVDVLEVGLDRLRTQVQRAADRRRRLAARGQPQDLELARAEQGPLELGRRDV